MSSSWYRPPVSWHAIRQALSADTGRRGRLLCRDLSDAVDRWTADLLAEATGGNPEDLALVAVGGYGRRELCPGSDLDLVLLHTGRSDIGAIADAMWYPIWDGGARLDHSVRRPGEVLRAATDDLRVQLGLLDGRVVAGDPAVAGPVLEEVGELWRRRAPQWYPVIVEAAGNRRERYGDLPFLLEPDLKESHGGLRDAHVVRCLARADDTLREQIDVAAVEEARLRLLDVRVELHRAEHHPSDRLVLQVQDDVAGALGLDDADTLMADVAAAGRAVSWVASDAWRRLAATTTGTSGSRSRLRRRAAGARAALVVATTRAEPGVAIRHLTGHAGGSWPGEVTLDPDGADPSDPALALRMAAVAAERSLPLAGEALAALARAIREPPDPWPAELRAALVRALAAGAPAVAAFEALDHYGLMVRLVPEWAAVRNKPQRNAYHRFTVDRHLLEAAARAAPLALAAARPDLLLVGTWLHDIGKGFPGDHTETGQQIVDRVARRMGFPDADVDRLVTMVRLHLLLPDVATRRDLEDPATVTAVAEAVGDSTTLGLLASLTEADSLATGPSAWGPWKAGLVAELAARVRARLAGTEPEGVLEAAPAIDDRHRRLITQARRLGRSLLLAESDQVTVVAPDRPGLLATCTGVLALFGLDVRSADVTGDDGFAVDRFVVELPHGRRPDWTRVADDLEAALRGTLPLDRRLAERAQAYDGARRPGLTRPAPTRVAVDNRASDTATVVDVRTVDGIGVLHRLTKAVLGCQLDVVAARVSTLGDEVVDAFYLLDPTTGGKVVDPGRLRSLEQALVAAGEQR